MAKKKKIGVIGSGAMVLAAAMSMAAANPELKGPAAQSTTQSAKKDAVKAREQKSVIVEEESKNSFRRIHKHRGAAGVFHNQRQYRKRWRQMPHKRNK